MKNQPYSIYLHIPFCQHRCAYCDFNTYSGLDHIISAYVEALCAEIRWLGRYTEQKRNIHTIFFGGGTPSLMSEHQFERILRTLEGTFIWNEDIEITIEANPGTLNKGYLNNLFNLGINRLSLGMQSAINQDLQFLERQHSPEEVIQAVAWARQGGFENVSLDLIFGLPGQSLSSWKTSLALALSLQPEHLSLYSLTIEHGTPMANWVNRGLVSEPDPDLAADMYEYACDRLEQQGYGHYEISNWAKMSDTLVNRQCRHNLQYWRTLPYLGLGAGAHGFAAGVRTVTTLTPAGYIKRMREAEIGLVFPKTPATISMRKLTEDELIGEFMLMGLRLLQEGVSEDTFRLRFGLSLGEKFHMVICKLLTDGLVKWEKKSLRLTSKGFLLANRVFLEFI
jgi:oxygen-independent coproporphyrinogen III oxidase